MPVGEFSHFNSAIETAALRCRYQARWHLNRGYETKTALLRLLPRVNCVHRLCDIGQPMVGQGYRG